MSNSDILLRAVAWATGDDTGMSSIAVCSHMTTGTCDGSYPHDPSDLGRCLRLLELIPEWKPRIGEMAKYGPVWAAYVVRWDEMARCMADEAGIDWSKGRRAAKTYDLMKSIAYPKARTAS